jgi:PAS domain S-box-containing protein
MSHAIPTILIVDDVPTNIHILGDTLAADYRLHVAMNGPDALRLAEQYLPDLVLLDIMMPGMDGFEVFRRLRAIEGLAEVPIIFVTALEGAADESAGLKLGAADYITKPYNPELVRLRVKNHLELCRQRDLLKEQRNRLVEQADQLAGQKEQLEQRNEVLKNALAQIKRLEGIIPICMCCKKIRDDQDSWQQFENYISEHSDALFSHGLCPHCAEEQLGKEVLAAARRGAPHTVATARPQTPDGEFFQVLCDCSPVGIYLTDSAGRNIYSNPRLEQIMGLSAAQLRGEGWQAALHPEDHAEALRYWSGVVATGRGDSCEFRLQSPGSRTSVIRSLVSPVRGKGGTVTGYVGTIEDISHQAHAREEVIKIQKLESLGLLAGGIAHDFNNILTGIIGNISLAQGIIEASSQAQGVLREAEQASERAVGLSRQLLTFARGGDPIKKAVSVRYLVSEAVSLALRGSNVQGVLRVSDRVRAVEVDEEQLLQGLGNVIINGAQAMPDGGKLTVEADDVQLEGPNRYGLAAGEYVRITVSDEGPGIPASCLGKVFDPYFTTKPNGTGLGLASTYSILAKHRGHVAIESPPGKGASVILYLPSVREIPLPTLAGASRPGAAPHAGGSVLVMDDEQMIRTIAEKMLDCLGYQVVTCESGAEAISLYAAALDAGHPFQAVIMDLTIAGGMGGREAARHILALDPRARLVVSSGYCNDPVMANYRDYGFCCALPKPYRASDLSVLLTKLPVPKAG